MWFRSTVSYSSTALQMSYSSTPQTSSVLALNESDQALPHYLVLTYSFLSALVQAVSSLKKCTLSFSQISLLSQRQVTCLLLQLFHPSACPRSQLHIHIPLLPTIEIQRWLSVNKYIFWENINNKDINNPL